MVKIEFDVVCDRKEPQLPGHFWEMAFKVRARTVITSIFKISNVTTLARNNIF